ncbi:MAG: alpha/beta hydrolase [Firmicutes bacterium]|nr:alpha/beta hydrolase [Bacillota bacterium]
MNITHYYEERGQEFVHSRPLILLHGNGEDSSYFKHQLDYFGNNRRVIAIDTRGHGKTPRGEQPFTIRQFSEDLLRFLNHHELNQIDLLGFSDGGNIALIFTMNHPERVHRLILNGANLFGSGVKSRYQLPIIAGYKVANRFAKKDPKALKNAEMLGLMVNDPHIDPRDLKRVAVKTLLITGTKDMIKDSHTELIRNSLPNAHWVRLDGDHFIANKEHEEFNCVAEIFLDEN